MRLAGEMGHFMAAAAGNSGVNEDIRENLVYPAGFSRCNPSTCPNCWLKMQRCGDLVVPSRADLFPETAPYIMSVAASDYFDDLGFFSNYGVGSVDLAAPGMFASLENSLSCF